MAEPIGARIDRALASVGGLASGTGAYAALMSAFRTAGGGAAGLAALRNALVDLVAKDYRRIAGRSVELVEFVDRGIDFLFDLTNERTVLVHGFSRAVPANSRDAKYHRGYPRRAGADKGHAFAHAQGGFEGGPNYFPQAATTNRRLSAVGNLWRDIETYLAGHAGLFAFVRLVYDSTDTDTPVRIEYGLLSHTGQFRVVNFPNG